MVSSCIVRCDGVRMRVGYEAVEIGYKDRRQSMGLGRTKRGPRHRQSSHSRQRCPPEPKAATRGATTARGPSPGGAAEQISTFRSEVSPSEKKFDRAVNWWRDVHSSPSIVVRANDERKSSMTTCNLGEWTLTPAQPISFGLAMPSFFSLRKTPFSVPDDA